MEWNEKVMNLMQAKGITQKQLSNLSGIATSSISRYLKGEKSPRMDVVVNIAKALNVETNYFFEDDSNNISAYDAIESAIARKGNELTSDEKTELIALLLTRKES